MPRHRCVAGVAPSHRRVRLVARFTAHCFLCFSCFSCFSRFRDAVFRAAMLIWRCFPRCHAFIVLSRFYGAAFIPPSCFHRAVIFPPFHRVSCFHRAVNVPRRGCPICSIRGIPPFPYTAPWDLCRVVEIWMRGGCLHSVLCLHGVVMFPRRGKRSTAWLAVLWHPRYSAVFLSSRWVFYRVVEGLPRRGSISARGGWEHSRAGIPCRGVEGTPCGGIMAAWRKTMANSSARRTHAPICGTGYLY